MTTDALRDILLAIDADRLSLRHGAHALRGIRTRLTELRLALTAFDARNDEYFGAAMRRIVLYAVLVIVQLCVWPADMVAFGPVASFIAGQLIGQSHMLRLLAHLTIPLVIFSIDVVLGLIVMRIREENGNARGWRRLAALFVAALPLLIVATGVAVARLIHDSSLRAMLAINFAWLGIVIGVTHATFIYAAKLMHESRAYVVYALRRRNLTRTIARQEENERHQIVIAGDSLITLVRGVHECHARTGDVPAIGPLDSVTVDFIQHDFSADPASWPVSP